MSNLRSESMKKIQSPSCSYPVRHAAVSAIPGMVDDFNVWILGRQTIGYDAGTVLAAVVDDQYLELLRDRGQNLRSPARHHFDVPFFVVSRKHDGDTAYSLIYHAFNLK